MRAGWVLATVLALVAGPAAGAAAEAAPGRARPLCTITDPRIDESSGLAAAGGELFTQNDGGTELEVFVLDLTCKVRRVITNPTDPFDVEDLARAADGSLWLGDTGDNDEDRPTVALERLTPGGEATVYRFTYPDGPHDAEAVLYDRRGRPYIVTKDPLTARVYTPAAAMAAGKTVPLKRVGSHSFLPTGTPGGPVGIAGQVVVTGGAVAADGSLAVLRTYTDAYVWKVDGDDLAAALAEPPARRIALPATRQGEGIAFAADGKSLLTSTEGRPSVVYQVPLGDLAPTTAPKPPGGAAGGSGAAPATPAGTGNGFVRYAVAAVLAAALVWGGIRLVPALRRR
jgi:hypothetical protein